MEPHRKVPKHPLLSASFHCHKVPRHFAFSRHQPLPALALAPAPVIALEIAPGKISVQEWSKRVPQFWRYPLPPQGPTHPLETRGIPLLRLSLRLCRSQA